MRENISSIFAVVILSSSIVAAPALAATYYVNGPSSAASDSNPGSQAAPWKTITKAADTLVAGDTVVVMAGTYSGIVTTKRAGSAASGRISFVASGQVSTGGWSIQHDYVTLKGFRIPNEIKIGNANQCQILDNEIIGGWINWTTLAKSDSCLVKGNHLHSAKSPGGDFPQMNIFGTNHLIEGNEIGPSSDIDAFRIFGSRHVIRGNYVHDITYSSGSVAHMDMIQTFGDNGWVSNNIVIENNRFINSQGQLFNTSQDGVSGISDYIFRNNVFANIKQNANVGLPNFYFYNNTLYNTGIIYQVTGGAGKPFNGTNLVVKNNLFIGVGGCGNSDFDNVYNNPSNLSQTRSSNMYANCSGQALKNYRSETGGINGGSPNFRNVASNDFSIQSPSVAIGAGVVLSGFSYDLLGASRPAGTWDLGAYQFTAGSASLQPPQGLSVR
jgi:Protein of unknown function (DUF1565)